MHSTSRRSSKPWLAGSGSSPFGWADVVVIPLIAVLSVPALVWFAHNWTVIGNDAARYLFAGLQLISGQGLEDLDGLPFNGDHGPAFPALIGSLILVFSYDAESLAWAVRLIALVNPLLAYFLVKRISSPLGGLIAAALVSLFGYNLKTTINIDAVLLTFYLLALLTLVAAIKRRRSSVLALLSGVLLGASILTKETALANLPLALLAVVVLEWDVRGALWHYVGVVLLCLPWWIWVWFATGEVYLVNRLPLSYQLPIVVVSVIFVCLGAVAYASGMVARFLGDERRRRWTGWFVVVGWTISLTGLLLATTAPALAELSFEALRLYLAELLAPSVIVLPVVVVVSGYVIWRAVSGQDRGPWRLLALALLFQVPVCLLVTVEGWAPRQFLVPQTLLFCALAALVADALKVAAGAAASPENGYPARLAAAVGASSLVILLLVPSMERVQALLPENPMSGFSGQRTVAPQATEMVDWMAQNVPEGEHILVTPALGKYLMFLDGGRHKWTFLRLDQAPCEPRPSIQVRCDPSKNAISRTPPDAVWIQKEGECRVISLSMSNLIEQARRTDSGYVMVSGNYKYPGILELPSRLEDSGAFEVVHAELDHDGKSGTNQGVVLLKSTGRAPEALPTQMDANTLGHLRRCEQSRGPGYENRMRSGFPNGILRVS